MRVTDQGYQLKDEKTAVATQAELSAAAARREAERPFPPIGGVLELIPRFA